MTAALGEMAASEAAAGGTAEAGTASKATGTASKAKSAPKGGGMPKGAGNYKGPAVLAPLHNAKQGRARRDRSRQLLVAEFVICMIVLALSPLTGDSEVKPVDWMKRGSAMCALFLILGLVSSVGRGSARACTAFGGLVTLVLLVDQRSIFTVIGKKLQTGPRDAGGGGAYDGNGNFVPGPTTNGDPAGIPRPWDDPPQISRPRGTS